jgi:hypothetical protein
MRPSKEQRDKMRVDAPLLGEPAATEVVKLLNALEEAEVEVERLRQQVWNARHNEEWITGPGS